MEMIRLVSSGTEAVMSAVRVARGFTNRDKILKFIGCYHGHSDGLLMKAGSGVLTEAVPDSAGIPKDYAKCTLLANYNDENSIREIMEQYGEDVACIVVEPVSANMGVVPPKKNFLKFLREITKQYGSLLIFDEVITGFRLGLGGAQEYYGITPDLTTFGKIVGGGMPLAVYGGRKDVMSCVAPVGSVYQAGTLSGNPLAMAAGITSLKLLLENNCYTYLENLGEELEEGLKMAARRANIPITLNRVGAMFCLYFTDQAVCNLDDAMKSDRERFARYFQGMLDRGVFLAPSQFEAGFLSTAHTEGDIEKTVSAAAEVFKQL